MILAAVILLILLTLLGMPIFGAMFGAAMLGLYSTGVDFSAIPIEIYRLANAPVLLAIPLFTFAGYLLSEGGTSQRLVRFSQSLLGWVPGGLGMVALLCSAFFTAITGATGVTIIALGGLLLPALLSQNYGEKFSLGLITTSGSLGLTFAPSLPIILYGFVSGASIEKLFMAGILPGILMVGVLSLFSFFMGSLNSSVPACRIFNRGGSVKAGMAIAPDRAPPGRFPSAGAPRGAPGFASIRPGAASEPSDARCSSRGPESGPG